MPRVDMAKTEYSATTNLPVQTIWHFVQEMDNWAHLVAGYQRHEKRSETDSLWTLKGDLGMLTRTLTFEVAIVEWNGPERVSFALRGVNEPMEGQGSFAVEPVESEGPADGGAPAARIGVLARAFERLVRLLLRRFRGPRRESGDGASRLRFQLRIDPGGPMAPMINALIKPAMAAAAEDLATGILGHLEGTRGDRAAPS